MHNKNLRLLMINYGIADIDLAKELKLSLKAVRNRLLGKTDFKRNEMILVKKKFFPNYSMEQLFDDSMEIVEKINYHENF